MKSLSVKLIVYCCILILIVCGSLGTFSYLISSDSMKNEVDKSLEQLAFEGAIVVRRAILGEMRTLEAFANNEMITNPEIPVEEKIALLEAESKRAGHVRMGISDLDGNLISSNVRHRLLPTGHISLRPPLEKQMYPIQ